MSERFKTRMLAFRNAVMLSPGETSQGLRMAIACAVIEMAGRTPPASSKLPDELVDFVDKVARNAYLVTDEDFDVLKRNGYSEDAILDIVTTVAMASGLARLNWALEAMGREKVHEA